MNEPVTYQLLVVLAGAGVGLIVGLTGVGGGSLMTPLLTGPFGLPIPQAVGTDLWFAGLTKGFGAFLTRMRAKVDYRIVLTLLAGSLPASVSVSIWLKTASPDLATGLMRNALGLALLLTGLSVLFKLYIAKRKSAFTQEQSGRFVSLKLIVSGLFVGGMTSLTSIGAGAVLMAVLLRLYPHRDSQVLVASDVAHAVPLTLLTGMIYASQGKVQWSLLALTLVGSLPGIAIGFRLGGLFSQKALQTSLASLLTVFGAKYLVGF
jgi:uncharacterized protein